MLDPDDVARLMLLVCSLPPRALVEDIAVSPTFQRDQSGDIAISRDLGRPDVKGNDMTVPGLATRLDGVEESAATAMAEKARTLRAQGIKVIGLSVGEPDFPTPPHVVAAATTAAEAGDTKYPPVAGTPALRAAVQRKFRRDNGLDYALNEILVTNGGKQAIFDALMATCNPGDEVIIPTPPGSATPTWRSSPARCPSSCRARRTTASACRRRRWRRRSRRAPSGCC